jgi:WD40 repeat protein
MKQMAFSLDGKRLLCPAGIRKDNKSVGQLTVWDVPTQQKKGEVALDTEVGDVKLSPDGKMVAFTTGNWPLGNGAGLWDVEANQQFNLVFEESHPLKNGVDFCVDGKVLVSSYGQNVMLFNVSTRKPIAHIHTTMTLENLMTIAASANGKFAGGNPVLLKQPGIVSLWHLPSRKQIQGIATTMENPQPIFSADGRFVAMQSKSSSQPIEVWELVAGQ